MEHTNRNEKTQNEIEFIRLLKQENKEALDKLWEALYLDSVKIARKYRQSEDMGYDAAVKAYGKLTASGIKNFNFKSAFRSYCWVIISREMLRLMKKEVVFEELEVDKYASPEKREKLADTRTIFERIKPCIEHLKGNRLNVFEMIDLEGQSPKDVAEKLGLSRNNVNKIASRVRLELRRCLEEQGYSSSLEVLSF